MTHDEIQRREIPEQYVRGRLSEAERAAFEDHYFACDECFAETEALQKFVDGVHDAAAIGSLQEVEESYIAGWFRPAFFIACAASLFLAVAVGWILFVERPRYEQTIAQQRQDAEAARKRLDEIEKERNENKIAIAKIPVRTGDPNLPLVMLESSRAGGAHSVTLPVGSDRLALWIELPPNEKASAYRLTLVDTADANLQTIEGLKRNSYGAIAAAVPADALRPGTYRVRLYSVEHSALVLAGEYRLEIRR